MTVVTAYCPPSTAYRTGGVAERQCTALEMRRPHGLVGSNPTPSVLFLTRFPAHRGIGGRFRHRGGVGTSVGTCCRAKGSDPSAYRVSSNRLLVALLTGLEALPRLRGNGEGALREPPVVPGVAFVGYWARCEPMKPLAPVTSTLFPANQSVGVFKLRSARQPALHHWALGSRPSCL